MKKNKLAIAIFISLATSIVIGVLLQGQNEKAEIFLPLGTIYVNLIKMIMVPFSVFFIGSRHFQYYRYEKDWRNGSYYDCLFYVYDSFGSYDRVGAIQYF